MEASKLTVGDKTFDLNHLGKKKKTNLRRKLVIEYIQGKPAGVISEYDGDKPRTHYYAVIGAVRVVKPKAVEPASETLPEAAAGKPIPDFNAFVKDMQQLGVGFTLTITNKEQV
jgi:hypothetical protein